MNKLKVVAGSITVLIFSATLLFLVNHGKNPPLLKDHFHQSTPSVIINTDNADNSPNIDFNAVFIDNSSELISSQKSIKSDFIDKQLKDRKYYLNYILAIENTFDEGEFILFLESDPEFLNILADEYLITSDAAIKNRIETVVSDINSEEKLYFSQELVESYVVSHRQLAYKWFADMSETYPEALDSLLNASQVEYEPKAIATITSVLSHVPAYSSSEYSIKEYLQRMSLHDDATIASQAIAVLSARSKDEVTQQIIVTNLLHSSSELKEVALDSLRGFQKIDADVIAILDVLANNENESFDFRHKASDLKMLFLKGNSEQ